MGNALVKRTSVVQNLQDAGCDEEFINRYMCLCKEVDEKKQLRMLDGHRNVSLAVLLRRSAVRMRFFP